MKANIRLSLSRLNPVSVLVLLRNVISKMTGNANFPTPKVPLADMTTLADNLSLAIDDANAGSLLAKSKRDDLVHSAKEDLNAQADYVRSICGGDRSMLLSSGFELAKERTPIGIPGVPANLFTRMTGKMGQLEVRFDPELYNSWNAVGSTTRVKHLVTDLESYKAYWFCVSAIGTAGESAQSGPALGRAA